MLVRCILPEWAKKEYPDLNNVVEGDYEPEKYLELNRMGYNVYFLPNYPSNPAPDRPADGGDIDIFTYVFLDMDLKTKEWPDKEVFIAEIQSGELQPTYIIDSGNGIHAYWYVSDLTAMSFLRLSRRLMRKFRTDPAVSKIFQLMRVPGTRNTKKHMDAKPCEYIMQNDIEYTSEDLDKWLPPISAEDESYCKQHHDKTYKIALEIKINETLPTKFSKLLRTNKEVRQLFSGSNANRSNADFRLAHILHAEGYSRGDAMSVLVNCAKPSERAPAHRNSYASNIVDKVWSFEKDPSTTSSSVKDILRKGTALQGTRIPCWEAYDGTIHGFRLTEVLGLIGGAGSGKTTLALNYFYHFAKRNPEYIHLFVSLEQPKEEIANRWVKVSGNNENLHEKVHLLDNYNEDGTYKNLALFEIEEHILALEKSLKTKVGCVVIDHIGVLKKESKEGESQGLIDICHQMKAFAIRTKTFLVMQSQTSRAKAGIGDIELDKDAAYGTTMFEWYCDYVVTTWQPLKRIYAKAPKMTCSAFKYCKIRHKNVTKDKSKEDVVHVLMFDQDTEILREMTQKEEVDFDRYNSMASQIRGRDRKKEPTRHTKLELGKGEVSAGSDSHN